ncbi:winged helix-turn-helix domain-containing protein [Nesterenkonia sp. LB17]|uniref:winged helix-turn-helix domain-containing protein n=1 Tax=Nesterenkonia sp. LB17 TaxID=2901230 RepID=UPI001F4CDCA0|nr:winged helix-turn-helix domain-containing protein [Nesterenkonia sp. LB17]MCH8564231.1 winged helix-turn-helix domain-containing protein [Nesterenkonia sp. LB17]
MMVPAEQPVAGGSALRLHTRSGEMKVSGDTLHLPHPDAAPVQLAPGPLALLRALMKAQGAVLSREHLLAVLPHCGSEHALEMWVSRLRQSLPDPSMVKTVVKRGYRLVV